MRKLTQKLVLSVVTMALVVIALGTSTFAWFTLTNTASIGTFDGQIVAGTGIEVSLDDYRWFNGLTTTQIEGFLFNDGVFPVGPTDDTTSKYGNSFRWDAITSKNGEAFINLDETTASANSYIEFTLYFRSEEAATIQWTGATLGGAGKPWVPDASFLGSTGESVTVGSSYTVYAKNGARVSVKGTEDVVIYQAPTAAGSTGSSGNQTTFGYVTGGQAKYWEAKNPGSTFASFVIAALTANAAYTDPTYSVPATGTGEAFEIAAGAVSTLGSGIDVLTLTAPTAPDIYYTGSVVIRVWLDGWDADTYNALFNAYLSAALTFEVA